MMDTILYQHYMELTNKGNRSDAERYKSSFVPDYIYKFYSLGKDRIRDKLILDTLSDGKVYLSLFEQLNDPFDGDTWYISDEFTQKGVDVKKIHDSLINARSQMRICSFTENDENNMPMWAYYANSHKGFCVKYHIDENIKKNMFPISYVEQKLCFGLRNISNIFCEEFGSAEQRKQMHEVFLANVIKHKSWCMEKEIRLILFQEYFSLRPEKIYIGKDCSECYREKLIEIAYQLGCEVFLMESDKNSSKFVMHTKKIYKK